MTPFLFTVTIVVMVDNFYIKASWVNPKIEIRNRSSISGTGTFAKENIQKGEIMIVQGGRILHATEVDNFENIQLAYHGFQIEKDFYIYPVSSKKESLDGIFGVNHSCDPTCGFSGQITMISMRDILKGEEITFDYAMSDMNPGEVWEDMHCMCGAKTCRKIITGNDWKILGLQRKYHGYFSTYIERIIGRSNL